jgi:hypothetical protein
MALALRPEHLELFAATESLLMDTWRIDRHFDNWWRFGYCGQRRRSPILQPATAGQVTTNRIGALPLPALPGWGFGYGCTTLEDRATAKTPQAAGVVALINTALEGGFGAFVPAIRNAVFG